MKNEVIQDPKLSLKVAFLSPKHQDTRKHPENILSITEILATTHSAHSIDDGGRSFRLFAIVEPGLLAHQRPQLVQVDGGAVGCVPLQVVVSHTHLTEVPRMADQKQEG